MAIMSLARWVSATAFHYIGNAPVNCVTAEYKALQQDKMARVGSGGAPQSSTESGKKELDAMRAEIRALEERAGIHNDQLAIEDIKEFVREELEKRGSAEPEAAAMDAVKARRFVRSEKTAAIHAVAVAGALVLLVSWATGCGWKFGLKMHTLLDEVPDGVPWRSLCDRCAPEERRRARMRDGSSDESGSSE